MQQALPRIAIHIHDVSLQSSKPAPISALLPFVALFLVVVACLKMYSLKLDYDISRVEQQIHHGRQQMSQLEMEMASRIRNAQIENLARIKLGLQTPTPGQHIRIN